MKENDIIAIPVKTKLEDYTWSELMALSKARVDFKRYNIKIGDAKDGKVLVDFGGTYNYNGLIFMYDTKFTSQMNRATPKHEYGHNNSGYAASEMAEFVETLYDALEDEELKSVIREVVVKCNDGGENCHAIHELKCHMFLPSAREVGCELYPEWESSVLQEGIEFAYFETHAEDKRLSFCEFNPWWLRSATSNNDRLFLCAAGPDRHRDSLSYNAFRVVATFVI